MSNTQKNIAIVLVLLTTLVCALFIYENKDTQNIQEVAISQISNDIKKKQIHYIVIKKHEVYAQYTNGTIVKSLNHPYNTNFINQAIESGCKVKISEPEMNIWNIILMLLSWLPMIIITLFFLLSIRKMNGGGSGGGGIFGFGKSRAKTSNKTNITFKDVAGIDETKEEVEEVVNFLKKPDKFTNIGAKIPKGILLFGEPGTGKTLLAKAIAGEAGVPFLSCSGSEFVEMFVGVGASRVRDLFSEARKKAPCIIFIDEIDAIGKKRGSGASGGNDEREQTLNQILVEIDGFNPNSGIVVIATTNRVDVLDKALLRPGRFDRKVMVSLPDIKGRVGIFKVHLKNIQLDKDVSLEGLAKATRGFSGADIANAVNEAAINAVIENRKNVSMSDLDNAVEKHYLGKERKSMIISEKEKTITAYHEAGHALLAIIEDEAENPHKATIMPRSTGSLGHVLRMPSEDMHYNTTKNKMLADVRVGLAGRIAEEIMCNTLHKGNLSESEIINVTTGAASDMNAVYNQVYYMVTQAGMSKLGMIYLNHEDIAYGKKIISEKTKTQIDEAIHEIIERETKYTRKIMIKNKDKLTAIAKGLLYYETLNEKEILEIYNNGFKKPDIKSEKNAHNNESELKESTKNTDNKAGKSSTTEDNAKTTQNKDINDNKVDESTSENNTKNEIKNNKK